jgi:hypothetical protein
MSYDRFSGDYGRVWEGSGSTKPTLEQQLHQFAAPPWSWTLPLELRRCVWLRQQLQLRKMITLFCPHFFARMRVYVLCCACVWCVVHACVVCAYVCVRVRAVCAWVCVRVGAMCVRVGVCCMRVCVACVFFSFEFQLRSVVLRGLRRPHSSERQYGFQSSD